jgi:3-oxoacyl-[acyl-carrier protein] reductase
MDLGLNGKSALISGGTHGIGLAIADLLKEEGCETFVFGRSKDKLKTSGHKGVVYDALEGERSSVLSTLPKCDILINNVGGGGRWGTSVLDTPIDVWDQVYAKNARIAMLLTRAVLPRMVKNKWGRVVTISSIYGKEAGGRPWFNVAKSAEISLMKSLSQDKTFVRKNITFNTVCPGHIHVEGKADEKDLDALPAGRMGAAAEVASVAVFLCGQQASLVNGACITVDGGESRSF